MGSKRLNKQSPLPVYNSNQTDSSDAQRGGSGISMVQLARGFGPPIVLFLIIVATLMLSASSRQEGVGNPFVQPDNNDAQPGNVLVHQSKDGAPEAKANQLKDLMAREHKDQEHQTQAVPIRGL